MKYLEDLEKNLNKTKEKIHKEKVKEEIKQKVEGDLADSIEPTTIIDGGSVANTSSPVDSGGIQPSDIDIKIKKENETVLKPGQPAVKPEDILIKVKKE